jgi:hypothetical protein
MTTTPLATRAQEAGLVVRSAGLVEGMENIDDKELKIGSAVLVQAATVAFTSKGIPAGKVVNTQTEKELGSYEFIPAFLTKRWFLYDNSGPTPKFVAASNNENDPIFEGKLRQGMLTKEQKAQKLKAEVLPVIYVIAINEGAPIKIAFKKASGYYAGQDLYTLARKAGGALWNQKYKLGSKLVPAQNGNPPYYALTVDVVGTTTEDERAFAKQLNDSFKVRPAVVDDESVPF